STYNSKPIFVLTGRMSGLKITNLRNGYSLQMAQGIANYATRATIDCGARTVLTDAQSPLVTLGAGQTDWMRIEAGENTLKVEVTAYGDISYQAQYSAAYL